MMMSMMSNVVDENMRWKIRSDLIVLLSSFYSSTALNRKLRVYARFIVVCLLLNKRENVQRLLKQLREDVSIYKRQYRSPPDVGEWKMVIQELSSFLEVCNLQFAINMNHLLIAQVHHLYILTTLIIHHIRTSCRLIQRSKLVNLWTKYRIARYYLLLWGLQHINQRLQQAYRRVSLFRNH